MNAKELKRIKSSIVTTKDLITRTIPITLSEEICESINCYAYALGIMWYNDFVNFQPGFTGKSIDNQFDSNFKLNDSETFMQEICSDLQNLGISYRQIELDGKKSLAEGEYLIKVFCTKPYVCGLIGDFHFVRYDNCTGIWFHKVGWYMQPEVVSDRSYDKVKWKYSEPDEFYDYSACTKLEPLGYFAIKEK